MTYFFKDCLFDAHAPACASLPEKTTPRQAVMTFLWWGVCGVFAVAEILNRLGGAS
jgi:hypothetical protein